MRQFHLTEGLEFRETAPYAQPLYVDADVRILRFMLQPGQTIEEHSAPGSPFTAIVVQGEGYFSGADGQEQKVVPNMLLHFVVGEKHRVRAGDRELIFVGYLHGVATARPDHVGGELAKR